MMFTHSSRPAEQHVVIAGAGRVGHHTAQVLGDSGHEVHLTEPDSETVDQVTGRRTGILIEGDATDPQIIRQTEPEEVAKRDTYELDRPVDELRTALTEAVLTRADGAGIDPTVMGTHGRGRVEQVLRGSVTERTVRTADVPVVTVRLDEWFSADGGEGTQ